MTNKTASLIEDSPRELRIVTEGVETFKELEVLRVHRCDQAQGFYFSRPAPPRQFAELLKVGIAQLREIPFSCAVPDAESAGRRDVWQKVADVPS